MIPALLAALIASGSAPPPPPMLPNAPATIRAAAGPQVRRDPPKPPPPMNRRARRASMKRAREVASAVRALGRVTSKLSPTGCSPTRRAYDAARAFRLTARQAAILKVGDARLLRALP